MSSENVQGQQKTFQNTQQYASIYVHKFLLLSRIFYRAILGSELYRLSRYIAPYKQSLS